MFAVCTNGKYTKNAACLRYATDAFISLLNPWKMFVHLGALSLSAFTELQKKARWGTNRLELASREG